jgi:hypothetical protein
MLPSHALSDREIKRCAKDLNISNFRNVYMRDSLPKKPHKIEKGVINLDSKYGDGTHWVCYKKYGNIVNYYDSYGNLPPPVEFKNYMKHKNIFYNRSRNQDDNTIICGHLCLVNLLS